MPEACFYEDLALSTNQKSAAAERRRIRSTTVICVRRNGEVVMAADGQVTMGDHVLKHSAKKDSAPLSGQDPRRICRIDRRCLQSLHALRDQAGAVCRQPEPRRRGTRQGLAHRQDAAQPRGRSLVVADKGQTFLISGSGDVIEPDERIAAIGSGGSYATRPRAP